MAKLKKFCAYRKLERPYTRISKYRKKSYIRITPTIKIIRFDMGDPKKKFEVRLDLIPKSSIQVRQEAIESARQTSARWLEKNLSKNGFHFKIRIFPFQVLRENPLAAGAGADRMSTGMAKPFGKPIGIAAQIKKGKPIFSISVDKQHIAVARSAMARASKKMPCSFSVTVVENK